MVSEVTTLESVKKSSSWIWKRNSLPDWPAGTYIGFDVSDVIALRFGNQAFPVSKIPGWSDKLSGEALSAARSSAAAADSQMLVSIGEFGETVRMIGGAVSLLQRRTEPFAKLRKRYVSGNLSYKDFLHEAANLNLLIRYGIMPLVYDIQGYIKALSEPRRPTRNTVRSVARDSGVVEWSVPGSSSMISSINLQHRLTYTREYRATCLFEYQDDMQSRVGLRLADVPSAAWELTRLSFVADWFANIGDYIGSATLGLRADVIMQCVSEWVVAEWLATYSESGVVNTGSSTSSCSKDGSGAKVKGVYTRKTRRPFPNTATGQLTGRVKLNANRVADGLSLLATTLDISSRKSRIVRI